MDKKEMLDYLSEKKRLTAPVATAGRNVRTAEADYEKARKKRKWGINILIALVHEQNNTVSMTFIVDTDFYAKHQPRFCFCNRQAYQGASEAIRRRTALDTADEAKAE